VGDDDGSWRKGGLNGAELADLHRQGVLAWKPVPKCEISASGGLAGKTGTNPIGLGSRRDGLAYIPESAAPDNPRPLLVMFHGAGASARDVMPMIAEIAERRSIMVLAPDSRGRTWDVIEREYGSDVAFLHRALHQAFEKRAVDARHVAFAGFSDGGSYALSLGLINGELVSGALGFSPGYIPPTRKEDAPRFFFVARRTVDAFDAEATHLPLPVTNTVVEPCARTLPSATSTRASANMICRPWDTTRASTRTRPVSAPIAAQPPTLSISVKAQPPWTEPIGMNGVVLSSASSCWARDGSVKEFPAFPERCCPSGSKLWSTWASSCRDEGAAGPEYGVTEAGAELVEQIRKSARGASGGCRDGLNSRTSTSSPFSSICSVG
jgi:phospholipase/carboxylesterase